MYVTSLFRVQFANITCHFWQVFALVCIFLTPFQNFYFFNLNKLARFQSSKPLFIIKTLLFCKFVQINTQSIYLFPSPSLTHALCPDCLRFICLKNLSVSISNHYHLSLSLSLSFYLSLASQFLSPLPLTFFTWPYFILF